MQNPTRIGLSDGFVPSNPRLKGVNAGSPLRQSTINNITRATIKNSIKSSPFYKVKQKEEGYTLELKKETQYNYAESPLTAQMGIVGYNPDGSPMYGITVTCGVVNMEVPKINGRYIDSIDSNGVSPYITPSGTGYICVKVSADENKPFPSKDIEIEFVEGSLADKNTNNTGWFPLARIYKNEKGYSFGTLSRGNLVVNRVRVGTNIAVWYFNAYGY